MSFQTPYMGVDNISITKAALITKSDSTVYNPPLRAIYIGGAGDVALVLADDDNNGVVVFSAMPIGLYRLRIKKVMSTNTAATLMVGLI